MKALYLQGDPDTSFQPGNSPPGWTWVVTANLAEAVRQLDKGGVDLALADLNRADGPALELLARLRETPDAPPLVMLAADSELACIAHRAGADGCLTGPTRSREIACLAVEHANDCCESPLRYDALTGLPGRALLEECLSHSLNAALRHPRRLALLCMDLDDFTRVNTGYGHAVGDFLLREVTARLRPRLRRDDTLGRFSGDRFLLLLDPLPDPQAAADLARDLLNLLAPPHLLPDGREIALDASIGISLYPEDGDNLEALLGRAEAALHRAKRDGGGQFRFHTADMTADARTRLSLKSDLLHAIARNELELHFQPKADLHNGVIDGAEALLRWRRADGRLVPPGEFIPQIEDSTLILPVGAWVIDRACAHLRAWSDQGHEDIRLAVNVAARQFRSGDLERVVAEALARHGVAAARLELELTEGALMDAPEAGACLARLKALGVHLSLDDFGTGFSSLAYLARFPLDALKIDQSFVRGMVQEPEAAGIVEAVVALGRRLGLHLVAEGVETEAQLNSLRRLGCDLIQGYLFSRPVPEADFLQLLEQDKRLPMAADAPDQTLLLVDDEPHILSALRRLLRNEGYRILTAPGGVEALEVLARESVQVVMSDHRMPGMTGAEFLRRVRDLHPDSVRILLTGQADMEAVIRAINDGAVFKFLSKPWDDDQLRARLREAFRFQTALVHAHPEMYS